MSIIFNSSHFHVCSTGYKLENVARTYYKEEIFILDETQLMNRLLEKFGRGKKIDSLNYEFKDYFIKIVPYDSLSDKVSGYVSVYTADVMFKFSTYIPRTYIEYQNLENAIDYIFTHNPSMPYRVMEIFYPLSYSENVDEAIFYKNGLTYSLTYDRSYYTFKSQQTGHNFYKDTELNDINVIFKKLYLDDIQYINKNVLNLFPNIYFKILIDLSGKVSYHYDNKFISISINTIGNQFMLYIDNVLVNGMIESIFELKTEIDRYIGNLQTKIDQLKWLMK